MPNAIHKWEGAGVTRVSNMEEVVYPQPQCIPCSQSAELNRGTRKDSDLYIMCFLCVKWLIHIPQVSHEWYACQIFFLNDRENRKRGYEGQIEEPYLVENLQRT